MDGQNLLPRPWEISSSFYEHIGEAIGRYQPAEEPATSEERVATDFCIDAWDTLTGEVGGPKRGLHGVIVAGGAAARVPGYRVEELADPGQWMQQIASQTPEELVEAVCHLHGDCGRLWHTGAVTRELQAQARETVWNHWLTAHRQLSAEVRQRLDLNLVVNHEGSAPTIEPDGDHFRVVGLGYWRHAMPKYPLDEEFIKTQLVPDQRDYAIKAFRGE